MQLNKKKFTQTRDKLVRLSFYFNLLFFGIQDGFVFSFRQKEKYFFIFSSKIFGGCLKL